jgi:hypothetical protein
MRKNKQLIAFVVGIVCAISILLINYFIIKPNSISGIIIIVFFISPGIIAQIVISKLVPSPKPNAELTFYGVLSSLTCFFSLLTYLSFSGTVKFSGGREVEAILLIIGLYWLINFISSLVIINLSKKKVE